MERRGFKASPHRTCIRLSRDSMSPSTAAALRISTLTKLLSTNCLTDKFVQLREREHYENEVLPESTTLKHSICSDNGKSMACASAVTRSQQPVLGDGCGKLFLDVGSNIGIHARFLFEPELYRPPHLYDDIFDNEFWANRTQNREKICVLAFEPNPTHRQRHQELATAYARQGWMYRAFYAAVRGSSWESLGKDKLVFYRNDNHANNDWGFSIGMLNSEKAHTEKVEVATVDISQFVIEHVRNAAPRPNRVLMKMDIEGIEYSVLPYMLATNAFSYIDAMTAKFHHWPRGFEF